MSFYCVNQAQLAPYAFSACQSAQFIGQNLHENDFYQLNALLGSFPTNSSSFYSFSYENIESGTAQEKTDEKMVKSNAEVADLK